ncbi:MAG TPA: DUF6587 family protein [Oxalicibacterium sp.]|nr:DUF6587 family protein [Oxalicibacterium sp.]
MSDWIQGLIIAAAVSWSLLHLLRKYFPQQVGRFRAKCVAALRAPSQPRIVQGIGGWMQTHEKSDGDCESGCGGCSGCASNPQPKEQHPVTFHRRP